MLGASQLPSSVLLNIGSIITPVGRSTSLSALIQSIQTVTLVKAPLLPAGVEVDVKKQKVVGSVPLSPAQPALKALDVSHCSLEPHAHKPDPAVGKLDQAAVMLMLFAYRLRTCPVPRTSMQGFWWL